MSEPARTCDLCGKPATSAVADTMRHKVPGAMYVQFSPTGFVRYGCDEHPANQRSPEELTMLPPSVRGRTA